MMALEELWRNIIRSASFVCLHLIDALGNTSMRYGNVHYAGSNAVDVSIVIHLSTDGKIACQLFTYSRGLKWVQLG